MCPSWRRFRVSPDTFGPLVVVELEQILRSADTSDPTGVAEMEPVSRYDRVWYWKKRHGDRKGMRCRLLVVGKMRNALFEFEDGFRTVSDLRAARRIIHT
ncbi:hypothetical protein ES705_20553 [subsurface metagenome]